MAAEARAVEVMVEESLAATAVVGAERAVAEMEVGKEMEVGMEAGMVMVEAGKAVAGRVQVAMVVEVKEGGEERHACDASPPRRVRECVQRSCQRRLRRQACDRWPLQHLRACVQRQQTQLAPEAMVAAMVVVREVAAR